MSDTTSLMTRTYIKYEHLQGVLIEDYVPTVLDLVAGRHDHTVSTIIFGNDGGVRCMIVHYGEPLTDEQLANPEIWQFGYGLYVEISPRPIDDLARAAKQCWPEVRVFKVPGCLCCNGEDNLLDYDCEL
jgi:hypothetical protein